MFHGRPIHCAAKSIPQCVRILFVGEQTRGSVHVRVRNQMSLMCDGAQPSLHCGIRRVLNRQQSFADAEFIHAMQAGNLADA
jgi:hypothetical protein